MDKKRKEDLVVMHQSKRAFVQVDWSSGKGDYKKIAQENIENLSKKQEDFAVALDFWPYNDKGMVYEVCYKTKKKTEECILSAAAEIPGGIISFYIFSITDEKLIEDVVYILTSVELPKN